MSTTYYQIYREEIIALARSLVIKHSGTPLAMNDELRLLGHPVNEDRPETWKYYLNLNGEYHASDQMISVRSMDTLETIDFTKENLKTHRATYREYLPGSRFYLELIDQYPNMVDLINGILNPIDTSRAIEARDGEILHYDHALVEINEDYLIRDLQIWIYSFYARWFNVQYTITDDLYLPAFIGHLSMQLPGVIERLRLRNVRTRFVHTFHIREYLASHNGLDKYIPYLNKGQQLWLYRNVRYLQRHVGKQDVFYNLIKNILTVRNIPIQGYDIGHLNTPLLEGELYPDVEMIKRPINVNYIQGGIPTESVNTILNRQYNLTRDNPNVMMESERETIAITKRDQYSLLPTKVLESEIVDRTESSVRSVNSVLINEWIHLATSGRYTGFITVTHPNTGELLTMTVKDAFIVALYAFNKINHLEMPNIPSVYAYDVLRTPLPSREELLSIIDRRHVPTGMVEAIRDRITPLGTYRSPESFNEACLRLHREYIDTWQLYSFQERYLTRGYCEQLVKRHFMDIKCRLVEGNEDYDAWLLSRGWDITALGTLEFSALFTECVAKATGANVTDRRSLADIQRALLSLMSKLSSYSIHFLQNINTNNFWFVGWPATRLGDIGASSATYLRTPQPPIIVNKITAKVRHAYRIEADKIDPPINIRVKTHTRVRIPSDVGFRLRPHSLGHVKLNVSTIGVKEFHGEVDNPPTPSDNNLGYYSE